MIKKKQWNSINLFALLLKKGEIWLWGYEQWYKDLNCHTPVGEYTPRSFPYLSPPFSESHTIYPLLYGLIALFCCGGEGLLF